MTKKDIKQFIKHMAENYNDFWEPEDVERVYGDYSLEDAISDRAHDFEQLSNIMKIAFGKDPLNGKHW